MVLMRPQKDIQQLHAAHGVADGVDLWSDTVLLFVLLDNSPLELYGVIGYDINRRHLPWLSFTLSVASLVHRIDVVSIVRKLLADVRLSASVIRPAVSVENDSFALEMALFGFARHTRCEPFLFFDQIVVGRIMVTLYFEGLTREKAGDSHFNWVLDWPLVLLVVDDTRIVRTRDHRLDQDALAFIPRLP